TYGNKDKEFFKFQHLPKLTTQPFRIALTGALPEQLSHDGWEVDMGVGGRRHKRGGWQASQTPLSYRQFIQQSRAEFAVAKQGYVAMRGGWFSDRSTCYLASGRPVLIQDTGQNLVADRRRNFDFRDIPEALKGIEDINADYQRHCQGRAG